MFNTGVVASPEPESEPESEPELFPCRRCDRVYTKECNLKQHIYDRHVGTRCYWPHCGTTTHTELELIEHLKQHQAEAIKQGTKKEDCPWPDCGKGFTRIDTARRCVKKHIIRAPRGI
ncbi:hypothetical protein GGR58DRAFT_469557 [Xylaria digitata]|nr:hypothetical protein GGR58DRAFT_469557 [Xylaria digitata]